MRFLLLLIFFLVPTGFCHAASIEEHILVNYPLIVKSIERYGFAGPFGREVAKFALMRQIVEDGADRNHSLSIVGMSVGEPHASIMKTVGLTMGQTNEQNMCLRKVTSSEGNTYYSIHGPRANVCSATAIALLWDSYVNKTHSEKFKAEECKAWNSSKEISSNMAGNCADSEQCELYNAVEPARQKAIEKANRLYSPTAAETIKTMVKNYDSLFEFTKPNAKF